MQLVKDCADKLSAKLHSSYVDLGWVVHTEITPWLFRCKHLQLDLEVVSMLLSMLQFPVLLYKTKTTLTCILLKR